MAKSGRYGSKAGAQTGTEHKPHVHVSAHMKLDDKNVLKWIKTSQNAIMWVTVVGAIVWTALGVMEGIEIVGYRYLSFRTIVMWLPMSFAAFFVGGAFWVFYQSMVGFKAGDGKTQLFDRIHYDPIMAFWGTSMVASLISFAFKLSAWFRISTANINEYDDFNAPLTLSWSYTNTRIYGLYILDIGAMYMVWGMASSVWALWRAPIVSEEVANGGGHKKAGEDEEGDD